MKPRNTSQIIRRILVLVVLVGFFSLLNKVTNVSAATGIYHTINFQGKIVNKTDGTNIASTNYNFTFKLYDAPSGGNQLPAGTPWSETQSLPVTNGIFQATLGSSTSFPTTLDFNNDSLYLDITFNGETFGSRVRLTAVPYAFNAEKVNGLTVTDTTGTLTIPNGTTIAFSGANNLTLSTSGTTTLNLPTTGTLSTLAGTEALSNKTIDTTSTGLVFSGGTTDITTVSNQDLTIIPNGTGNVGVGTSSPQSLLDVGGTITGDSLFRISGTINAASGNAVGFVSLPTLNPPNGQAAVGTYIKNWVTADTGETVSYLRGIHIDTPTKNGTGTITSNYQLYLDSPGSIATNNFAIYSVAGTNYFGGNVGIGSTAPGQKLDVTGNATASGNITAGGQLQVGRFGAEPASLGNGSMYYNTSTNKFRCSINGSWADCDTTGAGSPVWSTIQNPAANLSLSMSTYTTGFNWATGTGTNNLFNLTTDASSNGTGSLFNIQTGTSSTVQPMRVRVGSTEALSVNSLGYVGVGTASAGFPLAVHDVAGSGGTLLKLTTDSDGTTGGYLELTAGSRTVRFGADSWIGPHFGSTTKGGFMFLDNNSIGPMLALDASNNQIDLGSSLYRFKDIYSTGVNTNDIDTLTFTASQNMHIGDTRTVEVVGDYAGVGELGAGGLIATRTIDTLNLIASSVNGDVAGKVNLGYFNGDAWYSGLELSNVTGGAATRGNLLLMKSGGYVGIGTTTPNSKLDVRGGTISTGESLTPADLGWTVGAGENPNIFNGGPSGGSSYGDLVMANSSATPAAGNYLGDFLFAARSTGNLDTYTGLKAMVTSQLEGSGGSAAGFGGNLEFWTRADNGAFNEKMRISNNGNVSIGTSDATWGKIGINGGGSGVKTLVVRGNSSDNANLQEWQTNSGTALTTINKDGFIDLTGANSADATWNMVLKFNGDVVGGSEVSGGFGNGVIKQSGVGRTLFNFITNSAENSLFSGGINGDGYRRFAITGAGLWQVGPGTSTYDTVLQRLSSGGFQISTTATSAPIFSLQGSSGQSGHYLDVTSNGGSAGNILTIDSSGNIGMGSTSPAAKLDIGGTASVSGALTLGSGSVVRPAYGPLNLQYKSDVNAWTTGLTIQDTTGFIGIGTTAPVSALQVIGNITSKGAGDLSEKFGYGATADGIYSVALGNIAKGNGPSAIALGYNSAAEVGSIAIGASTTTGNNSVVVGTQSHVGHQAVGIGGDNNVNDVSVALGLDADTTASNQFVVGSGSYPINDFYFGKGVTSTTPNTVTVHGTNGTGVAGGALSLTGGTGTSIGSLLLQPNGGNVGIGTTNALYNLHISGNGSDTLAVLDPQSGSANSFLYLVGRNGGSANSAYLKADWDANLLINTVTGRSVNFLQNETTSNLFIKDGGNIGIGTTDPNQKLEVSGSATASANLTAGGQLQIGRFGAEPAGLGNGSMYYNTTTNTFRCFVSGAWANCGGSGSQTPWAQDIVAAGYDLTDLSNLLFRETTGAPTGTNVGFYRDNSGDLTGNVLTGKAFHIAVNGSDEYNFTDTDLNMGSNNLTNVGSITGSGNQVIQSGFASSLTIKSGDGNVTHSSDLILATGNADDVAVNSGNIYMDVGTATAAYGSIQIGSSNASSINFGSANNNIDTLMNTRFVLLPRALPTADGTGEIIIDSGDSNKLKWWNGSGWQTAGGSGSSLWSGLSAPGADLSLAMSTYKTTFNWATGTGANNLFSLTTASSSNGTGYLMNLATGTSSTVKPLHVSAGAVEALLVDATGNVGIGSTSPAAKLDVSGSATISGGLTFAGGAQTIATRAVNQLIIGDSQTGAVTFGNNGSLIINKGGAQNFQVNFTAAPTVNMASLTNAGQATTTSGANGLDITYGTAGSSAITNAALNITVTNTNNTAGTVIYGMQVATISGQLNTNETALLIGTGWDKGLDVSSPVQVNSTLTAVTSAVIGSGANAFTFNPLTGPNYTGTARPYKTVMLSPEYPGAVMTQYYGAGTDSTNNTGSMTSDVEATAGGRSYYSWTSTTASPLQSYVVAVRVTLPPDFSQWCTTSVCTNTNALQIDYATSNNSASNNALDVYLYNSSGTQVTTPSTGLYTNNAWTTLNIQKTSLDTNWSTAGATATIYLRVRAMNTNITKIGDIKLNYLSSY